MKILQKLLPKLVLLLCLGVGSLSAMAQGERVYASGEITLVPGGDTETQYFAVNLENAAMNYVAYQMDIVLPDGVELAYYEGEPDIYIYDTSIYPTNRSKVPYHSLAIKVNKGFIRVLCADIDGNRALKSTSGELFLVGVVASPYVKPGDIKVELRNVTFSDVDLNGPTYDSFEPSTVGTASTTSTLTLKVSASNKFSTAILPFDAELPAGLEAYSCASTNGENLVLSNQTSMKAFTPYILYAPNGYEGTLSGTVDAAKYEQQVTEGYLTGTVVAHEVTGGEGHYVLQNQGEGPMFYRVGDTSFNIPAGKCWLTLPASQQGVSALQLHRPTGIETIPVNTLTPNAVYDLSGRRITNPTKGIYIVGGKKVLK